MAEDNVDILEKPAPAAADDAPAADAGKKPVSDADTGKAPDDGVNTEGDGDKPEQAPKSRAAASEDGDDDLGFSDEEKDAAPAEWPTDWREKLAGDNDKLAKRLARFTSPEALLKSWQSLEQKLSSGEYKRTLPDDASDEDKAAWRKENGIPDAPDGYTLPEIKGHEWSDADKQIAGTFLADLHAANTPQPVAEAALKWYANFQAQRMEAIADLDRTDTEAREDALRTEWGPKDYRPHIKLATQTFQDDEFISPDLRSLLASARTPDGRRVILHPDFTRFLAERGLERRGPGGLISGEQGARMGGRLDEIRKIRDTDIDRYYAEGLDREYLDLSEKVGSGASR